MSNIAEPVPHLESVPPFSETRSSLYIRDLLDTDRVPPILEIPESEEIAGNSEKSRNWKQFREFRNWKEYVGIPELEGIRGNSGIERNPREFRTAITHLSQRIIFNHNSMREPEGEK
jgi:hypothetical protein